MAAVCSFEASHAQVTPSGLGTAVNQVGAAYEITGGTRPGGGANLFHSFGQFSILAGETALFMDPAPPLTTNILGRVTDGIRSDIYGTIDTATYYPGANLFLINPAGIVFGATASLNVGGSVNISTADYLRLADGARFEAIPSAQDALLSSAPVAAFGFVAANPAAVEVQTGSALSVQPGQALSLVGGDVTVTGGTLSAPGGQINLVSVASPGEVSLPNYQLASGVTGGTVTLSAGAAADVSGDGGGTVIIRGGQLVMDNAFMTANSVGFTNGAPMAVDINVQGTVSLGNASVVTAQAFDAGNSGEIGIIARNVQVMDGSVITTSSLFGSGQAGNITIAASDSLSMAGTDAFGNPSLVSSQASFVDGNSGTINVSAPSVMIDRGMIQAGSFGDGLANNITIQADNLNVREGGVIEALSAGNGATGAITITASGTVSVSGQFGGAPSRISNLSIGNGGHGGLTINAGTVSLTDGSRIQSEASSQVGAQMTLSATNFIQISSGSAITSKADFVDIGPVQLSAPGITLNQGTISTQTVGAGTGGPVTINTGTLNLLNGALIRTDSLGTGDAGNININAGQLRLTDSSITTQAFSATAGGGNVMIMAGELVRLNNSQINTSVAGGPTTVGGNILIDPPFVVLQNNSQIFTGATLGQGGNITIVAGALFVDPTSSISASSQLGISGSINVQSPVFFLSGTLVPLPKTPVQAASLLQQRCAARMQGGKESNFVQRGRDGLPPEPGGWLTSPMLAAGSPSTLRIGQDEPSLGQDAMLAQADVESSPMPGATSTAGPLTKLASAGGAGGCGLDLVLAQ